MKRSIKKTIVFIFIIGLFTLSCTALNLGGAEVSTEVSPPSANANEAATKQVWTGILNEAGTPQVWTGTSSETASPQAETSLPVALHSYINVTTYPIAIVLAEIRWCYNNL